MYLDNVVALALGLEGTSDPSHEVVAAAVAATGYAGYVAPDFVRAECPLPEPKPTKAVKATAAK